MRHHRATITTCTADTGLSPARTVHRTALHRGGRHTTANRHDAGIHMTSRAKQHDYRDELLLLAAELL